MFAAPADRRIGEVWFEGARQAPLLAKYLFTSERLSIQVHPNDEQARARGLAHGKSECWYLLNAEPGATIGLGLTRSLSRDDLRKAAVDGSIEELMDWRSVRAGDFFFVPAGTIHAIGAGISLLEFQQNSDVTYRLYDYGRPRELHLDDAVAVASTEPYAGGNAKHLSGAEDGLLVDGPQFLLAHSTRDIFEDRTRWIIPLEGEVRHDGESAAAGDCLLVPAGGRIDAEDARMLIGASS
jgi:mannose-6-phosphate isomerase